MKELINKSCNLKTKIRPALKIAVIALLAALVFEALTLIGAPTASVFDFGAWGKKRILVVWATILVIYAVCQYFGLLSSLRACVVGLYAKRQTVFPRILYLVCGFVVVGLVGVVLFWLVSLVGVASLGVSSSIFCFATSGSLFLIYANRKNLALHPERLFVSVGVVMGICIAVLTPIQTSVSPDDHIHYDHAVALSYLSSPEYTGADKELLFPPYIEVGTTGSWSFSEEEYGALLQNLNELNSEPYLSVDGFHSSTESSTLQYSYLGYIPSAIGLWLGRLLHLPFVAVFLIGRISNVLFFFTLVYFGTKNLRSHKIFALAFSLIPTVLFISANYSYDIWVIGWLLFGFLRYLSWLQNPEEKLTYKEVLIVILSFLVGLGPKAIYFPIFFLLLFIPKTKFPSRLFAMRYRIAIVGAALLVLLTFMLPFVVQGPGGGDTRGGENVNATKQVLFILEDPIRYLGILTNFLSGYLSLEGSASYTTFFSYLGTSSLGSLPLVALILIAVTDSGKANFSYALWRYRLASLALLCGTSALVASALYVSFTAVGHTTVAGCQGRYLLPLLVPFLTLFFNSRIQNENSRKWYNLAVLLLSMSFIIVTVCELSISVYTG